MVHRGGMADTWLECIQIGEQFYTVLGAFYKCICRSNRFRLPNASMSGMDKRSSRARSINAGIQALCSHHALHILLIAPASRA